MRGFNRLSSSIVAALLLAGSALASEPAVRITILSDAFGRDPALHKDWGFAALVEYGETRILFDTGNDAEHLEANARRLEVDLSALDFAVISHRHGDHTDGLRHLLALDPNLTIYVPPDEYFGGITPPAFFRAEPSLPAHMRYFDGKPPEAEPHGTPWKGARFVEVNEEREVAKGVRLVRNLAPKPPFAETPELSLLLETESGTVLVVGCSHPGIERILESAGAKRSPVRLLVGGLHLVMTPRDEVDRLARALRDEWKLERVAPGHCTGEYAFGAIRTAFESRYVYAGVGTAIEVP